MKKEKSTKQNKEQLSVTLVVDNSENKYTGLARAGLSIYHEIKECSNKKQIYIPESFFVGRIGRFISQITGKNIKKILETYPLWLPSFETSVVHLTTQQQAISLLYKPKLAKRTVVTVHDLIPLVLKEKKNVGEKILYALAIAGIKKAAHIIVDSEHTKKDVMKLLYIPEKKISVIYLGVDTKYFKVKEETKQVNSVLYVGSEHKRKNLHCLLQAIAILREKGKEVTLIKVGKSQCETEREKLKKEAYELGIEDAVVWKEYVEDICQEYNKAMCFVCPSIYEGFGFPILEAMASGCPVICSNATSLPELGGNAVLYFDPKNSSDLAEKIKFVLEKERVRKELIKKGLQRVSMFKWEKTVEQTRQVYEQLYTRGLEQ